MTCFFWSQKIALMSAPFISKNLLNNWDLGRNVCVMWKTAVCHLHKESHTCSVNGSDPAWQGKLCITLRNHVCPLVPHGSLLNPASLGFSFSPIWFHSVTKQTLHSVWCDRQCWSVLTTELPPPPLLLENGDEHEGKRRVGEMSKSLNWTELFLEFQRVYKTQCLSQFICLLSFPWSVSQSVSL